MNLPEDFLHYLWKFRLFKQQGLVTVSGESLVILDPGVHNKHAGPDFESSRLRIGETLWAGNVEIHLRSSDWYKHRHQFDAAYDNVILHAVNHHDMDISRADGTIIPVLELKDLIPEQVSLNYLSLLEELDWIPCAKRVKNVDPFIVRSWLHRVAIERLEEKSEGINSLLQEFKGSWDDAFYISLARNFGFKINAIPFEMLARSLPRQLLNRYKDRPLQIEALIFGQAGFLKSRSRDEYPRTLRREYQFLQKKHGLIAMDGYLWKYMRLRPQNFPGRRLAQFAALLIRSNHLFSEIVAEKDVKNVISLFEGLPVNSYWHTHYRFDLECAFSTASLGRKGLENILINTVCVSLMAYGRYSGSAEHVSRSLALLEMLPPEINALITRFKEIGMHADNAFLTQSLIQLKRAYCDPRKCLSCGVGMKLLNM